ncbi:MULTISPECIES: hypothetical protein [Paraburkholderia]|uniref:hypothetical protein n=1 Tax=Paraburkholderia TaxID=1822464 RepID=UPI00225191EE|nr:MULTISPECIES: hypothetical protein [Paraburkholderia]MCX4161515.1 hypothetical protein [Paraburkholderia megapolitana]MDN7157011.1 hypothetical protein [Paraburkholderia sp. CHISQ3]MDQ6494056.1 hypothetical protein [Paraburkholderia megapolitana]
MKISQTSGPGVPRDYQATLKSTPSAAAQGIWRFGTATEPLELTLTLSSVAGTPGGPATQANLWASYPLTQAEGVHKVIASWPIGTPQN